MNLFLELNPPDFVQLYPRGISYIYLMHSSLYRNVHLHGVMHLVSLVRQSESVPWPELPMKTEMDPAFKDKPQINTF